jgi:hypothetical protein
MPDEVLPRPSESRVGWDLAALAIVMTVGMIGWGWGKRIAGWGQSNQLAQMTTLRAAPTDGPATRAWTPRSNRHLR